MTTNLKRFTTEYSEAEDRIRLTGHIEEATPIVIWFSQRLFLRMLPRLLEWLEQRTPASARSVATPQGADIMQSFAQQAAVAALKPQAPVRPAGGGPEWLVLSVDITTTNTQVALTFRGQNEQSAALALAPNELRQWLSIVHRGWAKAAWPAEIWPAWITGEEGSQQGEVRLH
jgi:hypothetical protein